MYFRPWLLGALFGSVSPGHQSPLLFLGYHATVAIDKRHCTLSVGSPRGPPEVSLRLPCLLSRAGGFSTSMIQPDPAAQSSVGCAFSPLHYSVGVMSPFLCSCSAQLGPPWSPPHGVRCITVVCLVPSRPLLGCGFLEPQVCMNPLSILFTLNDNDFFINIGFFCYVLNSLMVRTVPDSSLCPLPLAQGLAQNRQILGLLE